MGLDNYARILNKSSSIKSIRSYNSLIQKQKLKQGHTKIAAYYTADKRETLTHSFTAVTNIYLLISSGTISSRLHFQEQTLFELCMHGSFQCTQVGITVYVHICLFAHAHVLPHPNQGRGCTIRSVSGVRAVYSTVNRLNWVISVMSSFVCSQNFCFAQLVKLRTN